MRDENEIRDKIDQLYYDIEVNNKSDNIWAIASVAIMRAWLDALSWVVGDEPPSISDVDKESGIFLSRKR